MITYVHERTAFTASNSPCMFLLMLSCSRPYHVSPRVPGIEQDSELVAGFGCSLLRCPLSSSVCARVSEGGTIIPFFLFCLDFLTQYINSLFFHFLDNFFKINNS